MTNDKTYTEEEMQSPVDQAHSRSRYKPGQRVGQYTVQFRLPQSPTNHNTYYVVHCVICCEDMRRKAEKLHIVHKGCTEFTKAGPPRKYEVGERYGQYTIVARNPINRRTYALVRCELCGKERQMRLTKLDEPHYGCVEDVPETVALVTDTNDGLGTKVIHVRKVNQNKNSLDAYVDVLVDGDYDGEYFENLSQYMIISAAGYVQIAQSAQKKVGGAYLHHLVIKPKKGHWVRFKNGNPLDCRTSNLEQVTPKNAIAHRGVRKFSVTVSNKSGYHGVFKQNGYSKFVARFRKQHLGVFDTAEEAARVYDKASWEAYHIRHHLNFPDEYKDQLKKRGRPADPNIVRKQRQPITELPPPKNPRIGQAPTVYVPKTDTRECPRCNLKKTLWIEDGVCPDCIKELTERKQ